jgi:hypothetical protein
VTNHGFKKLQLARKIGKSFPLSYEKKGFPRNDRVFSKKKSQVLLTFVGRVENFDQDGRLLPIFHRMMIEIRHQTKGSMAALCDDGEI